MPDKSLAWEILQRSGEHLILVFTAVGLALLISLPLGLWITRRPRWAGPVLTVANTVQTIPSLAIFGVLITVPLLGGIGSKPAIVALTLYALLPMLRGITTGMAQVPVGLKQAGRALGLNSFQVLRHVEIPLAMPMLMAGIRVAAVISVGVATIAAAIGAGGLGVFIFRGISMVNNTLILAGALPAAAIALAIDAGLGGLERRMARRQALSRRRTDNRVRRRSLKVVAVIAGLVLVTVVGLSMVSVSSADTIRIGSKNFTEQRILGELLAQQIEENTSLRVKRDFGLGGTFLAHEAVRTGQIDGYVEYTGTAWTAILNKDPPVGNLAAGEDPAAMVFGQAREIYADRFELTMFPSLGFENTYAVMIRGEDSRRLGIQTISDAAAHTASWQAGFGYEFLSRADGYPGLVKAYGLRFAGTPQSMDVGLIYQALADGKLDLIAGDSTSGLIPALQLQVLDDDLRYFPPYQAVPVFHTATLQRHPQLIPVIESLAGKLTAETMQQLNAEVDLEKQPVGLVVRRWRRQRGLVP